MRADETYQSFPIEITDSAAMEDIEEGRQKRGPQPTCTLIYSRAAAAQNGDFVLRSSFVEKVSPNQTVTEQTEVWNILIKTGVESTEVAVQALGKISRSQSQQGSEKEAESTPAKLTALGAIGMHATALRLLKRRRPIPSTSRSVELYVVGDCFTESLGTIPPKPTVVHPPMKPGSSRRNNTDS